MSPRGKNGQAQSFHLWLGHRFHFLVQIPRLRAKGGWASGCRLLALAVLRMTASETVSLHFIWYLHPSITSVKGLIFNQALGHLLDTEKLLSFPAKYISVYIFIDIDHP